jgi:hypothetical protein
LPNGAEKYSQQPLINGVESESLMHNSTLTQKEARKKPQAEALTPFAVMSPAPKGLQQK